MAILSPEQHAALVGELAKPEYADLSNDRPAVALWTNQLTAGGIISPGQAGAIMGLLSETIPDPDWPETVIAPSWTSEHFPGSGYIDDDGVSHAKRVTPDMVTEARS
jgi:hypothetical protein